MKRIQLTLHASRVPLQISRMIALCLTFTGPAMAMAQSDASNEDPAAQRMDHSNMPGMKQGDMKGKSSGAMEGMDHDSMQGLDHPGMNMDNMMDSMQGGSPPPDARDPDYSDGLELGPLPGMHMPDDAPYGQVLLDQFEGFRGRSGEMGIRLDGQAWYGTDLNNVWLKAESERSNGTLGSTRLEALYNRAFSSYFGWQAGWRHDVGGGPSRNWAALGIQGLAPYWFDLEATAYVGESGRTALRLEAEYELYITQRVVLQPDVEVQIYGKNDPERGIGSGLSNVDLGLRLRYEITRKFAPYIGVDWGRKFGSTADLARRSGDDVSETRFVAGIRLWY